MNVWTFQVWTTGHSQTYQRWTAGHIQTYQTALCANQTLLQSYIKRPARFARRPIIRINIFQTEVCVLNLAEITKYRNSEIATKSMLYGRLTLGKKKKKKNHCTGF